MGQAFEGVKGKDKALGGVQRLVLGQLLRADVRLRVACGLRLVRMSKEDEVFFAVKHILLESQTCCIKESGFFQRGIKCICRECRTSWETVERRQSFLRALST